MKKPRFVATLRIPICPISRLDWKPVHLNLALVEEAEAQEKRIENEPDLVAVLVIRFSSGEQATYLSNKALERAFQRLSEGG